MGDPYSPEEQLRLGDRAWSEMVETGVTLLRDTVMPVGNGADNWGDYQKDVALKQNILNANPDRLILVRTAAEILKAKREKKFAVVLGTQDTAMVGPELDRLAQIKKDGVMTVQLTYNNRNLAGDGAMEPANAGLSKLGRATIERIEAEKLLLDLSHGGRKDDGRGNCPCEAAAGDQPYRRSRRYGASAQYSRRDDQGRCRQGRSGRRLFHAVPDGPTVRRGPRTSSPMSSTSPGSPAKIMSASAPTMACFRRSWTRRPRPRWTDWQKQRIDAGIASPGEAIGVYPLA